MVQVQDVVVGKLDPETIRQATQDEIANRAERHVTFLPDPEPVERSFLVFSVDDHLCEPPDTFEGRIPRKYLDRAPRVVETADGGQAWLYDGHIVPNVGFNAVAGRPFEEVTSDPTRFEEMRRGAWDADARVRDMDLNGVYASINFPSQLAGFGGGRLQTIVDDRDLALATVRAYNQWHLEAWAGSHPDRLIATQLAWLHDPQIGAEEIRSNAAAGFKAVTFPDSPDKIGFPSVFTDHWDPIMRACAETDTVVCLHTGSGGGFPTTGTPGAPLDVTGILFSTAAMMTAIDWLFSGYPARYSDLKICLSEGGIGWVAAIVDRLDMYQRRGMVRPTGDADGATPYEIFRRNFWFCFLDEPTALTDRERIGVDRLMFEVDYPHADSNWPNSQELLRRLLHGVSPADAAKLTWQNASELFRHPVPPEVIANPSRF